MRIGHARLRWRARRAAKLNGIEVPPEIQKEIEELREKLNSADNLLKGL